MERNHNGSPPHSHHLWRRHSAAQRLGFIWGMNQPFADVLWFNTQENAVHLTLALVGLVTGLPPPRHMQRPAVGAAGRAMRACWRCSKHCARRRRAQRGSAIGTHVPWWPGCSGGMT